ncbi:hypothetical protein Goklo_024230, partial [Gossypium klotzschianum]|nr:hypothetical protein [Gossypium klotzschianum]
RQAPVLGSHLVLEYCLWLLHTREGRSSAYGRRIHDFTTVSKNLSRQSLLESCLLIFPKALGHVDEAFTELFDRLYKRVTPVSTILAETFRSLNACRKAGEGRFIGCVQLLLAWFHSHFWKVDKVSYQNLQEEDIEWRASWLLPDEILYQQYRLRQFIPTTRGLAEYEFSYKHEEIREEKNKADRCERKFQEVQIRNEVLERSLSENRKEKEELKDRVAELDRSLHQYQN